MKGADKNDPRIRELYKHIGYSLYGFWEIFYWGVNNEDAYKYMGRKSPNKKRLKFCLIVEVDREADQEEVANNLADYLDDCPWADDIITIMEEE